jgi:hypothetical protein
LSSDPFGGVGSKAFKFAPASESGFGLVPTVEPSGQGPAFGHSSAGCAMYTVGLINIDKCMRPLP